MVSHLKMELMGKITEKQVERAWAVYIVLSRYTSGRYVNKSIR